MAELYGNNYKLAYVDVPAKQIGVGEQAGRKRILFDSHTFAGAVNAIGDIIKIGKLPKGARVLEAVLVSDSMGTTGIFDLGWAASADGLELADANGFISGADAGGQAVKALSAVSNPGLAKKFLSEVDVQLELTEATDGALGDSVKVWIEYILD